MKKQFIEVWRQEWSAEPDVAAYHQASAMKDFAEAEKSFMALVGRGSVWSMMSLGYRYESRPENAGGPDLAQAEYWYQKAVDSGSAVATFYEGNFYLRRKIFKKAREIFTIGMKRGYAPSTFRIAGLYAEGWGGNQDTDMAESLYKKAISMGNIMAKIGLASLNFYARKGIAWKLNALLGLISANLQYRYIKWKDPKSERLKDMEDVKPFMGIIMMKNPIIPIKTREISVEPDAPALWRAYSTKDIAEEEKAYKALAERGSMRSMVHLASLYFNRPEENGGPDIGQTEYWYQKAIDSGSASATYFASTFYLKVKNLEKAFEVLTIGAERCYAPSIARLARMYENGWHVKKDITIASNLYKKAACLGNVQAKMSRKFMIKKLFIEEGNCIGLIKDIPAMWVVYFQYKYLKWRDPDSERLMM